MTDSPENYPVYVAETPEDSAESKPEEYKVGRNKPPREHQWKPLESGNPSGKRKREESCRDLMKEELDALISVQENGKTITVSKRKAWVKRVVNGAIQGNPRDEKILMRFEKPDETPRKGELRFINVDSEDEIPPQ
ncbi:MAG TPA: DUF5681 domain-containing protein [Stellaceae bacterium]|jgi:hypothetical protein|nr:DUF5681 domain-containing protein [Stellaceae bacterium]